MAETSDAPAPRRMPLSYALIPIVALVLLLSWNIVGLKSDSSHVPLVFATMIAAAVARYLVGVPWATLEAGVLKAIDQAMGAILILVAVGMLIASWIEAGVVPWMIGLGLKLIAPSVFLVTACAVCCVVSLATGSSWTTASTVGVALVAAGRALGLEPGMVAGAVVSGAYFGDKMSPLSDTTNLAPAVAGATLIEHVKHMTWTVTPAIGISLLLYAVLGSGAAAKAGALADVDATIALLDANFSSSPILLLPPIVVVALIARRKPALPALLIGVLVAVVIGLSIPRIGDEAPLIERLRDHVGALFSGSSVAAPDLPAEAPPEMVAAAAKTASLLDGKGGIMGMMQTVALILCAMAFGGVMEASGMLGRLGDAILRFVRGTGSLVATTLGTCMLVNFVASDQYMSIVVPGRMYRTAFLKRRLHPKNLSRCLEDSGTVTSALIPWNTCGAQMLAVLGVGAWSAGDSGGVGYAPYAFLLLLCPLVSAFYGFTGISIVKLSDEEAEARLKA